MGCACSKAVAAATQDEIDRLTSRKARRQDKRKQRQIKAKGSSPEVHVIPAGNLDTVHEAR